MPIVIEVLSPQRTWGTIARLARTHAVSRQTIYQIAAAGQAALERQLVPGAHGPHPAESMVAVDRNRLVRGSVLLTQAGVSQRDIAQSLAELLDTTVSPSWVNARLAEVEAAAQQVNQGWQPVIQEGLAGDEIYSNGRPNLLVVGNESLYIYALTRQPDCSGETWGCVLLEGLAGAPFASDAGTGLAAGVKLAQVEHHQLDWDHLLRPLWGHVARLEEQAYAALAACEARAAQFFQAQTAKRLAQHLAAWERLRADADTKVTRYDQFRQLARQVDAEFGLIERPTGQLRQPQGAAEKLRQVGRQLKDWAGTIYTKLSSYLLNLADGFFRYQPILTQALQPLEARWGAAALRALCQLWQCEAETQRHPRTGPERQQLQREWETHLEAAVAVLGWETLSPAWAEVTRVLERAWRGSMLAECVNNLPFQRGKRAGQSPAQLVGLAVPEDPLTLLNLKPKGSI